MDVAGPARRGRGQRLLEVAAILGLVQLVVVAELFADGGAAGHARYHALIALVTLGLGWVILGRWPAAGWASRAPALGLAAFAAAQLLESVGALGYAADNDTRANGIVVLHDIALGAAAIGLLGVVLGLVVGALVASSRSHGRLRWVGAAASTVGLAGGLFFVKTLVGF